MRNKLFEELLTVSNSLIDNIDFLFATRTKPTYFTRNTGKMFFKDIISFLLNFVKLSLQLELDDFFKRIKGKTKMTITKQAFSQARQKISPKAFVLLQDAIIKRIYEYDDFKTYKGYRLLAIDGTVLELNNSSRLQDAFGYVENQTVKLARALASAIYDIENDLILTAKITKYRTSERDLAIELIDQLKDIGLKKDIILFDRGYPSRELIKYLEKAGIKYVMRVSNSFFTEVNNAQQGDQVVKIDTDIERLRVLKFTLDSGVEETLITNLFEEEFNLEGFKELYFKRWGIEVKYDELKNKLQIENFTGDTQIAVEQDFYASLYLTNMASVMKAEANSGVHETNKDRDLKYEYKVNTNILIGKMKDAFIRVLLEENPKKRKKSFNTLMQEIKRNLIPIRPNRTFERKKKGKANSYPMNKKRCL